MESTDWKLTPDAAAKHRQTAEQLGMRIHSVLRGWTNFNSPKAEQVTQDMASVETALLACQGYGADALLLVPCRLLADVALPKPEEFDIEFNDTDGPCHARGGRRQLTLRRHTCKRRTRPSTCRARRSTS